MKYRVTYTAGAKKDLKNIWGLRFFPVDNYLVFYKIDEETEMVYVVRIMYSGRDIHKLLRQTEDVLGT